MQTKKIIYKVTCQITEEVYVGATTKDLETRRLDHEEKAKNYKGSYFHESIATYGPAAFVWEQIDTANTRNELAEKEQEYILKYSLKTSVYNQDRGGGFKKKIYRYNATDGQLSGSYDSLLEAAEAVGAQKTSISNACLGYNRTCKGYYWSYRKASHYDVLPDLRKKEVLQLTLEGQLLNKYQSVAEASRNTGICKTSIAKVCRGERRQSGGYQWKYEDEVINVKYLNSRNYGEQ